MFVDVRIPWEPQKQLGFACNRSMATVEDWVLILDYDVFLVNPDWYDISLGAIERLGHKAGLITCMTNNIGCPLQRSGGAPGTHNLDAHLAYAKSVQAEFTGRIDEVPNGSRWRLSGFFFITHKKAWAECGGFANKFLGMDNAYHGAIERAGYGVYIMRDLYCYHRYKRLWKENAGAQ